MRLFKARPLLQPIPWFVESEYSRTRSIMGDGGFLPSRYTVWRQFAESEEREMRAKGIHPTRIVIDAGGFVAWCLARNLPRTAAARRRYAREAMGQTAVVNS